MTLAPTPIIEEKEITAANLLRRIKALVLEEPKRLDMSDWVGTFQNSDRSHDGPACGTVGCIAGWIAVLLRTPNANKGTLNQFAAGDAREVLGIGTSRLFSPCAQDEFGEESIEINGDDYLGGVEGTQQHADAVAARIDKFLAAHPELETRVIQVRP